MITPAQRALYLRLDREHTAACKAGDLKLAYQIALQIFAICR